MIDPKDVAQAEIGRSPVQAGQAWEHYNGGRYTIVAVAIEEATLAPVVVYRADDHGGTVWTRPLANFLGTVVPWGVDPIPRFRRVG